MKLSALRKRATAAGVPEAEVEAAEDSGRPTEALIELLLAVQGASPSVAAGADVTAADVLPPAVRQTSMQRRSWQPLRKLCPLAVVCPFADHWVTGPAGGRPVAMGHVAIRREESGTQET